MSKKVWVLLADGFEEIEAITIIDVLRRAGLEVVSAGIDGREVLGAHAITVQVDVVLEDLKGLPDAVILPGGMPGAQRLGESKKVIELIQNANTAKKWVGAICAAPAMVLAPAGVLSGRRATCYPGFEDKLPKSATFTEERVVVDGNIITSRGPGSALEFSLKLVELLAGRTRVDELKEAMIVKP